MKRRPEAVAAAIDKPPGAPWARRAIAVFGVVYDLALK